jgi:hypothetical protein
MINADRELREIKEHNERTLRAIFRESYDTMGEEAKTAAATVLMWVAGLSSRYEDAIETIRQRDLAVSAIKETVREYAGDLTFHAVMHLGQRRDETDLRKMMYRMVYELTTTPKSAIARTLGIDQDHATVFNALKRADDLRLVDRSFRETYNELVSRVRKRIEDAEGGNMNHSSCQR